MDVKVKMYQIAPEVLQSIFTKGAVITNPDGSTVTCEEGLPEGAEFRGFQLDENLNCVNLFFEHDSFDSVSPGQEMPRAKPPTLTKKYKDEE